MKSTQSNLINYLIKIRRPFNLIKDPIEDKQFKKYSGLGSYHIVYEEGTYYRMFILGAFIENENNEECAVRTEVKRQLFFPRDCTVHKKQQFATVVT